MRTTLDPKLRDLRSLPAFADASPAELRSLGAVLDVVAVPAGRTLLEQGRYGHEFFLVISGRARVERDGTPVAVVGQGDLLGEMAVLDLGRRTATVVAETDMVLATGMRQHLSALLLEFPGLDDQVRRAHAERQPAAA